MPPCLARLRLSLMLPHLMATHTCTHAHIQRHLPTPANFPFFLSWAVLMEHFADEFNAQLNKASGGGASQPQDVRTAPRAMAKLRKQVSRTKQILSANSEAPMSVEELWQDRDFRSTITREKFEELAGEQGQG